MTTALANRPRLTKASVEDFRLGFPAANFGRCLLVNGDAFDWLSKVPENSLHAVVTDPPYGVKEYEHEQLEKRANGKGGIWRLPPDFDGSKRAPLPRFTALNPKERKALRTFFLEWSLLTTRALRPGAHVFLACNTFVSQLVYGALVEGGLEFRGELIRLVRTLRGGDRPKNCEDEFPGVCSMPRGCYEPWAIMRKPMPPKMTVGDCLREWQTGGLRRNVDDSPFCDLIPNERTPQRERKIANHPSLKPQSLMRQLVHAALPLGEGVVADTFMGSGSTVAAAEAMKLQCVGIERRSEYFEVAVQGVRKLSALHVQGLNAAQELF